MKDRMLHLKDKNGRVLAHVEMTNNRMFKPNLKIKTLYLWREGGVKDDEEVLKTSKALEAQMGEMEAEKNKAQFMAHVMKDEIFNPTIVEESDVVVSKNDMHDTHTVDLFVPDLSSSIPTAVSKIKGKIKNVNEFLRQTKTSEAQPEDIGNQKKNLSLNVCKDKDSLQFKSLNF